MRRNVDYYSRIVQWQPLYDFGFSKRKVLKMALLLLVKGGIIFAFGMCGGWCYRVKGVCHHRSEQAVVVGSVMTTTCPFGKHDEECGRLVPCCHPHDDPLDLPDRPHHDPMASWKRDGLRH